MVKRRAVTDDDLRDEKRQRTMGEPLPKLVTVNIETVRDLQLLLMFEQEAGPQVKQKIQSFKVFLNSIIYGKESPERSARRVVLLEYLQSQTSHGNDDPSAHIADIVRTWHFAGQANAEGLFASVVSVLALLLKTISSLIGFRACGNNLCKMLLQDDEMKLFDRGLSANVTKEHLISPCLRLLTEIVKFDGGNAARIAFRQREITLKRLDVFLGLRTMAREEKADARKKSSIRNTALRYLYANLRLQHCSAKMSIITQAKTFRAIFDNLLEDSPAVISELLEVLKKDVAMDPDMPLVVKSRFFNEWALGRLTALYTYVDSADSHDGSTTVRELTHDFLLFLCTSPSCGLLDSKEQHIIGTEESKSRAVLENVTDRPHGITTTEDKISHHRTSRLASFLQTLRPHASTLQSELIIGVFRKAPGLASDYFSRKKAFTFDPKPTATWIGYSSFLLGVLQLPLDGSIGLATSNDHGLPFHDSVLDDIIPLALNQKVLTRCLNQSTNLIKFISAEILIAAFAKVAEVTQICGKKHKRGGNSRSSNAAILSLTTKFCSRVPAIEHVAVQFRSCPMENALLQESLARLLGLYHEVIPQAALESRVDISTALSTALECTPSSIEVQGEDDIKSLQLDHMLKIAYHSPSMRWWHKSEQASLSPFTMLLKVYIDRRRLQSENKQIRVLLASVIQASQVLNSNDDELSLDVLVFSLQDCSDWDNKDSLFEFLDECFLRLVRKPIQYYDSFSDLITTVEDVKLGPNDTLIDLLLITIVEQWPYLVASAEASTLASACHWLSHYVELCSLRIRHTDTLKDSVGALGVLKQLYDNLKTGTKDKTCYSILDRALKDPPGLSLSIESVISARYVRKDPVEEPAPQGDEGRPKPSIDSIPPGPPQEQEDHPGLNRWTHEDIQGAIDDGAIGELLFCLCSDYIEIRQQAATSVRLFMAKLEASGYSEWQQTYVVLGELMETVGATIADIPLPHFAAALATRLLSVIADPLHLMYEKVNKFLHRGPLWNVAKLPSYWVDRILLNPPTRDEAHYQESEWLLDVLIDGLRTPTDFDIYRKCNIIERLLSSSASPTVPDRYFQQVVDLLFRCTYVGGSSTLITRCGLVCWIASHVALNKSSATVDRLRILAPRVYETSDRERVDGWSDGSLLATLDNLKVSRL